MEEVALSVSQFLTILDLSIAILGALFGVCTAARRPGFSLDEVQAKARSRDVSMLERAAVGLCVGIAVLGAMGLTLALARGTPFPTLLSAVFSLLTLLCGLPALVWRTRWRGIAEGVATVAISAVAFLSGFSIGFMFVPVVILMILVCIQQLRASFKAPVYEEAARVDSVS